MQQGQTVVSGIVGVEKLYYAEIIKDEPGQEPVFGTPVYLQGVKEIGQKITINNDKLYAENKVWETDTTFDSTEVTINVVDLLSRQEAHLMGHKLSEDGGVIYNDKDKPINVAILYKSNKANGKARYVVLYNNKFADSDDSVKGKEGKTDFQTKTIVSTGSSLKSNGLWKYKVDEEDGMTDDVFFSSLLIPVELTYSDVVYSDYSTGVVSDISLEEITFDSTSKKFKNVPSNVTEFTFKLDGTEMKASKSETWSFDAV